MKESVNRYTCDGCEKVTEDPKEITAVKLETGENHPEMPEAPEAVSERITSHSTNTEPKLHFCQDCWDIELGPGGADPAAYLCTESGTTVAMMQKGRSEAGDYFSREGAPTEWKPPFELVESVLSE